MTQKRAFHTGTVKKSITISVSQDAAWRRISKIASLGWLAGVKEASYISKKRQNIGAVRSITFNDNSTVEEHIVAWEPGRHFTYIATEGLPLRAYVATISLKPRGRDSVRVTWQSYLNSKRMPEDEFLGFLAQMGSFYEESLKNLKAEMERPPSR